MVNVIYVWHQDVVKREAGLGRVDGSRLYGSARFPANGITA